MANVKVSPKEKSTPSPTDCILAICVHSGNQRPHCHRGGSEAPPPTPSLRGPHPLKAGYLSFQFECFQPHSSLMFHSRISHAANTTHAYRSSGKVPFLGWKGGRGAAMNSKLTKRPPSPHPPPKKIKIKI